MSIWYVPRVTYTVGLYYVRQVTYIMDIWHVRHVTYAGGRYMICPPCDLYCGYGYMTFPLWARGPQGLGWGAELTHTATGEW